ncbi:glycosyltransferase family 4 protein [Anaerolineales bacterium]
MTRLLYFVNIPRFFVSHRLPLALAAQAAGYEVHVATSDADIFHVEQIQATGLPFHPLPLSQHGTRPLAELQTFRAIVQTYKRLKPDLLPHDSTKPVLYGGLAARYAGIPAVVSAMSGLGHVFISDSGKVKLIQQGVKPLLKVALAGESRRMIFQNPDDQARFIAMGLIKPEQAVLIKGSGVDTSLFKPQPEPDSTPLMLFAGRLMWQKGLGEFVESARALQGKARFVVVGYAEASSPDTVPLAQIERWQAEGLIEYWGKRDDMPAVLAQAQAVILPSSYGEGIPKVLIEAAACGRAIVTTNSPGCREIVSDSVNGLLVPPGDQAALNQAILRLIEDPALRQNLGAQGRERVLQEYDLKIIVAQTLALYESLLAKAK